MVVRPYMWPCDGLLNCPGFTPTPYPPTTGTSTGIGSSTPTLPAHRTLKGNKRQIMNIIFLAVRLITFDKTSIYFNYWRINLHISMPTEDNVITWVIWYDLEEFKYLDHYYSVASHL